MNIQDCWKSLSHHFNQSQICATALTIALILGFTNSAMATGANQLVPHQQESSATAIAGDSQSMQGSDRRDTESHGNETSPGGTHSNVSHGSNEALLEYGFGRFLVWLGKFHPAAVHFPIALLLSATFAELLSMRFKPEFFHNASRFSLWTGTIGAVGAVFMGWLYGGFRLFDTEIVLTIHRWNGTAIAALALLALWLGERHVGKKLLNRGSYRAALFVAAILVGLNGYLGGLMVYGPEQHQWPSPASHDR